MNLASFVFLRGGAHDNVNVSGALVHVLGDLLGSVAAIVAALTIRFTGWMAIDPILSVVVALLIVRSGWDIVRRAGHILLEGTPENIDHGEIRDDLTRLPGVADVHHIHVWSLTSGRPLATLHLRPAADADIAGVLAAAKMRLRERFAIDHSTIELDFRAETGDPAIAERSC